jgi:hypothetical protein
LRPGPDTSSQRNFLPSKRQRASGSRQPMERKRNFTDRGRRAI